MRDGSFSGGVSRLLTSYWHSDERGPAALLLAVLALLTLALVFVLVLINDWNRQFYEALQERDAASFGPLLLRFAILAGLYIAGAVYKLYFTQMLEMRWRAWLTRGFLASWLDRHAYYRLALEGQAADNPDQRLAEDLRLFTTGALDLGLGLLSSVVTLASFVAILWGVSGPLSVGVGGIDLSIPGYMVWAAALYALFGSVVTRRLGRPLIGLNFQQQRFEADFRFGLVRVRENAEGIALYGGESVERDALLAGFERIRANWWQLMRYTKRLTFFTVGYNQAAIVFPILVAAPRYFSGAITLGVLMQIANAFGQVQGALSWFVDSYGQLAAWRASAERLLTFQRALERAAAERSEGVEVVADRAGALRAEHLDLWLPNGRRVLEDGNLRLEPGERILLTGPNGSGKSTLFRAIAGIWPFGRGRVLVPSNARVLFLPQRPYIPIAALRDAVSYPARAGAFGDDEIRAALRATGLEGFVDRLDEPQNWSLQMSGGEQQRLAIARALLHRPDWLFLDEATAALDDAGERRVYELLGQRLPGTGIVSIAHRPGAAGYHRGRLTMTPPTDGGASRLLRSGPTPPARADRYRPRRLSEPV